MSFVGMTRARGLAGSIAGVLVLGFLSGNVAAVAQPPATPGAQKAAGASLPQPDNKRYLERLIYHIETTVEMASVAMNRGQKREVKDLADSIQKSKRKDIEKLRNWYREWYGVEAPARPETVVRCEQEISNTNAQPDNQYNSMMCVAATYLPARVEALNNTQDFDRTFLQQMIAHQKVGIALFSIALDNEKDVLRKMAKDMIDENATSIDRMRGWYQKWYR